MATAAIIIAGAAAFGAAGVGAAGFFGAFNDQISKNTVNDVLNNATDVTISNLQDCESRVNKQEVINLKNNKNQKTNLSNVNFDEGGKINLQCVQNNTEVTNLSNNIQENLNQQAKNLNKKLFGGGTQQAENQVNFQTNLTTNLAERFKNKCIASINQSESIVLINNKNGTTNLYSINFEETENDTVNCVQRDRAYTTLRRRFERQVNQTSSNKLLSPLPEILIGLAILGVIVIVLLVVFGNVFGGGESSSVNVFGGTSKTKKSEKASTSTQAESAEAEAAAAE
jgi:hypothetical protein